MHALKDILREIEAFKEFAFDTEAESTTSDPSDAKNPRLARITYVSLATKNLSGCFKATDNIKQTIVELLKNPALTCIIHNWPYDGVLLHHNGWIKYEDIAVTKVDTMTLSWLLDEENEHGLKPLVYQHFKYKMVSYEEATKTSPTVQGIALCNQVINSTPTIIAGWSKRRPYPDFDSPVLSKIKIRKDLLSKGLDKKAIKAEADRLLGPEELERYKEFAAARCGKAQAFLTQLIPRAEKEFRMYARDDAKMLMKLYKKLIEEVKKANLYNWFLIETNILDSAIKMHLSGVYIDAAKVTELREFMEPLIEEFEAHVYDTAKEQFNINSSDDIRKVLFDNLGAQPPVFRIDRQGRRWPKLTTEGDNYCKEHGIVLDLRSAEPLPDIIKAKYLSSDQKVLERVNHPLARAILDYRAVSKLYKTYIQNMLDILASGSRFIHTNFRPLGTDTGRWSSNSPNLQNIPSRAKDSQYDSRIRSLGSKIRQIFTAKPADELAPEGYSLIVADQSQIELRLLAHYCGDARLMEVYNQHVDFDGMRFYTGDIHASTSKALNVPRKYAKSINFGRVNHLSRNKTHSIQWNPYGAILSESLRNRRSVQRLTAQTASLRPGYATA